MTIKSCKVLTKQELNILSMNPNWRFGFIPNSNSKDYMGEYDEKRTYVDDENEGIYGNTVKIEFKTDLKKKFRIIEPYVDSLADVEGIILMTLEDHYEYFGQGKSPEEQPRFISYPAFRESFLPKFKYDYESIPMRFQKLIKSEILQILDIAPEEPEPKPIILEFNITTILRAIEKGFVVQFINNELDTKSNWVGTKEYLFEMLSAYKGLQECTFILISQTTGNPVTKASTLTILD